MFNFNIDTGGTGRTIAVRNPSTGEVLHEINTFTEEEVRAAVERARAAQRRWEEIGIDGRIAVLKRFQQALAEENDKVSELIAIENGKPLQEAMQTEVLTVNMVAAYFLRRAKKLLADRRIPMRWIMHRRSFIHYRPRGVVLVISPWNYPFAIPAGTVFMSLLAGNAVIHKPASLTPLIALKIRDLFDRAGLSPDLYQVFPSDGAMGSRMIEMGVDYVNFTGSTQVGRSISEMCGRLMIPCSMELGGKNPAIVCADADIERATASIVFGALTNAGQTCASVGRVYAHTAVYDGLVEKVVERVRGLRVGDPLKGEVDMGPMVDPRQIEVVERQVRDAVSKGARVLAGGRRKEGPGQFFEPTVVADATDDMLVIREETFGPVIPIMKVESDEEALKKANDSEYGLTAYVFSRDADRARKIARRLEAGTVMVNETLISFGFPETPWQGVKMSGTGRTHSNEGFLHLCYPYHVNEDSLLKVGRNPLWQPYSHKMYRRIGQFSRLMYGSRFFSL